MDGLTVEITRSVSCRSPLSESYGARIFQRCARAHAPVLPTHPITETYGDFPVIGQTDVGDGASRADVHPGGARRVLHFPGQDPQPAPEPVHAPRFPLGVKRTQRRPRVALLPCPFLLDGRLSPSRGAPQARLDEIPHERPGLVALAVVGKHTIPQHGKRTAHAQRAGIGRVDPVHHGADQPVRDPRAERGRDERVNRGICAAAAAAVVGHVWPGRGGTDRANEVGQDPAAEECAKLCLLDPVCTRDGRALGVDDGG